jgi:hypothetical protein
MLPEEVLLRLRHESRRQGTSVAEVVRQAVERHLPPPEAGAPLAFFAIGDGGPPDAAERVDEFVGDVVRGRAGQRG